MPLKGLLFVNADGRSLVSQHIWLALVAFVVVMVATAEKGSRKEKKCLLLLRRRCGCYCARRGGDHGDLGDRTIARYATGVSQTQMTIGGNRKSKGQNVLLNIIRSEGMVILHNSLAYIF